jgi:hypothetical protein
VTNFLVKVLMGATTDRELLELLTALIGKEEIAQESLTYGVDGARVATASIRQRELAPIHSLVQQRQCRCPSERRPRHEEPQARPHADVEATPRR